MAGKCSSTCRRSPPLSFLQTSTEECFRHDAAANETRRGQMTMTSTDTETNTHTHMHTHPYRGTERPECTKAFLHMLTPITEPQMSIYHIHSAFNKVSSIRGRDDSWPASVPSIVPTGDLFPLIHLLQSLAQPAHFCPNGRSVDPETPEIAKLYSWLQIWWQILNWEAQVPIHIS